MDIYFAILKFNFQEYLRYPFEFVSVLIQQWIRIAFFFILWSLILEATDRDFNIRELVAYFLLADGISETTMALRTKFGTLLRKSIKTGSISNFLIKPVRLLPAMFSTVWGQRSIHNVPALLSIAAGIILNPPQNIESILLFLFFFLIAGVIAFAFNLFEGIMTFYVESPGGIMNAMVHVARIFSGAWAPLTFFPDKVREILEYTPYPAMVFGPINSLSYTGFNADVGKELVIAIFWAVAINLIMYFFWRRGIKKYEAYGL